ncbi:MAG TPA: hypothetical protein VNI54_07505 [Thermoanaerobaculia bacterium]|nr:hypothetical protein [Thermoanaerobaculia bacterium]
MTTSSHEELSAASVIALIQSGAYPRDIVMTIARGFLPLAQDDLVAVLAFLGSTGDLELADAARTSLNDVPSRSMVDFATNESAPPEHLERLMKVTTDPYVLEALIRNRGVSDAAIADLARRAEPRVQEVIVINHARILRAPEILDTLLGNPTLNQNTRRLVHEVREEFFLKKARRAEAEEAEPELVDVPLDQIADLLERADAVDKGEEVVEAPPLALTEMEKKDERASAVWTRLQHMTVSEKVRLAFRGDRMIRMLLVRDRNRLICSAVMRNPRMTEQEAEAIAGMRNVDDEVLRILGNRRDWSGKYKIMHTLVRNPKAPVGVVLPFVNRLTLRDLKGLKDDKGVPQAIREQARKAYLLRGQKRSG